jgi:predicted TIM-barrel fold metal-dependent hydrolase
VIIDTHVHLGYDYTFDEDFTKKELLQKMGEYQVNVQIVQPGTCHDLETVKRQHDDIAALCREHPGHFYGMANPSPHLETGRYYDEISRCIEDLGFIAVKLHPFAHGVNPNLKSGRMVFEAARKYSIPLMIHTGSGLPFAGPVNLVSLAKEYSDVTIVMAHCGQIILANEAAAAFESGSNVYGDTSWTPGFLIKNWSRVFGSRFMFGSDHADNTGTELAKIRTVGLTTEEQRAILETTARMVFNLE